MRRTEPWRLDVLIPLKNYTSLSRMMSTNWASTRGVPWCPPGNKIPEEASSPPSCRSSPLLAAHPLGPDARHLHSQPNRQVVTHIRNMATKQSTPYIGTPSVAKQALPNQGENFAAWSRRTSLIKDTMHLLPGAFFLCGVGMCSRPNPSRAAFGQIFILTRPEPAALIDSD